MAILQRSSEASVARGTPASGRVLQRRCACGNHSHGGGECASCAAKKRTLQRRAAPEGADESLDAIAIDQAMLDDRDQTPAGTGRALDATVVARLRPQLGGLVDRVRVHDGAAGHAFARSQQAAAVTSGTDIYFAEDAYRPHTAAGRNLLLHELAHVWQQHHPGGPPASYRSRPGDRWEAEADRIATAGVFPGTALGEPASSVGALQRRTAAEQIASVIREAVSGWGTDEDAIFNALTGRTPAEIADIEAAYRTLSGGETLEARLRDELSGDDLARALSLLRGETAATEAARTIWNAVRGLGTDEEAIYAAVAGRTAATWQAIQDAYQQMAGEPLLTRLRDELNDSEWHHLQTLLPGAEGGAITPEDRATVLANQIEAAVAGAGTDEEAIYAALTGRTQDELREIERRYRLLTGEDMNARLREELNDAEWNRVQELLHPSALPERAARALRDAVQGPGTAERAIVAILTGRSPAELTSIRDAYQRLYGEALGDRLRDELSGGELAAALALVQAGLLEPEDEIYLAVKGFGEHERLFAVLTEVSATQAQVKTVVDRYAAKGYGDMLKHIRSELSGAQQDRAMELLHGLTPTASCSTDEREQGLEALSEATSMAQEAVRRLDTDVAAGRLTSGVRSALTANFNPGGLANAVTVGLAGQVRPPLNQARDELLTRGQLTCATPVPMPCGTADPCVANPSCDRFTAAWTCPSAGAIVRLCPALYQCSPDKPTTVLHEFVHHAGIRDQHYHWQPGFSGLTPNGTGGATDSLNNADSYAHFAKDVS